jgi:general L-amino acid transport system permease protein
MSRNLPTGLALLLGLLSLWWLWLSGGLPLDQPLGLGRFAGVALWGWLASRFVSKAPLSAPTVILVFLLFWLAFKVGGLAVQSLPHLVLTALLAVFALWFWRNLFSSALDSVLTIGAFLVVLAIVPPIYGWGVTNAVTTVDLDACRAAQGVGACWGAVREKFRLVMFGTYPFDEQWRPLLMMIMLLALIGISMNRWAWAPWLILAWAGGIVAMGVLMWGGVLGLTPVSTDNWGGLPLTLILSVNGIVFAFPLAILLALGRRSDLPVIKALCISFIELVRGVPLISVLFMASLMIPLFLPQGFDINKLLRAQVGIILFAAAYLAEVIRGGLQAIPKGQAEASDSLGLGYWQKTGFIVLPQALTLVIPPLVNSFIATFKDTSLVIIIGLFDLLGAARMAASDPEWRPYYVEGLAFIAMIYFVFCFTIARYSLFIEGLANAGKRR